MCIKEKKKRLREKECPRCQLCGKLGEGSGANMIHVKCALEYVQVVLGYGTYKFKSPLDWSER